MKNSLVNTNYTGIALFELETIIDSNRMLLVEIIGTVVFIQVNLDKMDR